MADRITKEQRRKNMAAIRSVSKLETQFSKALWKKGIRYRRNVRKLFGSPDISIEKYKVVIFIDSCFWHKCPLHFTRPKSNQEFWDKKISRNVERDKEVTNYYEENDWNIIRFWEHEVRKDFEATVSKAVEFINNARIQKSNNRPSPKGNQQD